MSPRSEPSAKLPLVDRDDQSHKGEILRQVIARRGRLANFYRMVANSPYVAEAIFDVVWALWERSEIGRRSVELAILRVGHLCMSEYEWSSHVPLALTAGVTAAEIDAVRNWPESSEFGDRDRIMLEMIDLAVEGADFSDELESRADQEFTAGEKVELLILAGLYRTIAFMLRTFQIPLDEPRRPGPEQHPFSTPHE